jgi:hypothetical protein
MKLIIQIVALLLFVAFLYFGWLYIQWGWVAGNFYAEPTKQEGYVIWSRNSLIASILSLIAFCGSIYILIRRG